MPYQLSHRHIIKTVGTFVIKDVSMTIEVLQHTVSKGKAIELTRVYSL